MKSTTVRERILLPIVGAALGAAVVLAVTLVPAGVVGAVQTPPAPDSVLQLLTRAPEKTDALPATIALDAIGQRGLVDSTSRLVGTSDDGRVWVGAGVAGEVCVILELAASKASGSACAATPVFVERGLALAVSAPTGEYVEAYLASDGNSPKRVPPGLEQIATGLLVGDTRGSRTDHVTFVSISGSETSIVAVHPTE